MVPPFPFLLTSLSFSLSLLLASFLEELRQTYRKKGLRILGFKPFTEQQKLRRVK